MSSGDQLTGFLRFLRKHGDAVEADLARFYRIDYRDRWRYDNDGRPLLPLRRLYVLVQYLPNESAVARITGAAWTTGDYLLSDLLAVMSGEPHPDDPRLNAAKQGRRVSATAIKNARERSRERRQRLGIKGSVLRRRSAE